MTAPRLPGLPPPFCASCLTERESDDLRPSWYGARLLTLCKECRAGHPRSGRWSFGGGRDAEKTAFHAGAARGRRDE